MLIFLLSNLIAQIDQLAPLLIQMSGVRLEQRKQDLIGHGEVMLKAIHLAPARISYEIRETTFIKRTIASRFNRCWETAEWKTGCVALTSQLLMFFLGIDLRDSTAQWNSGINHHSRGRSGLCVE
jgi:hypothetical protein